MWLKAAKARWECTLMRQNVCCCSVAKPVMLQPRRQRATTPAPGPGLWAAPRCQTRRSCCPWPRVAAAAAPPAAASRRSWLSGAAHPLGHPAMDQSRVPCVSLQALSYRKAGGACMPVACPARSHQDIRAPGHTLQHCQHPQRLTTPVCTARCTSSATSLIISAAAGSVTSTNSLRHERARRSGAGQTQPGSRKQLQHTHRRCTQCTQPHLCHCSGNVPCTPHSMQPHHQ